MKKFLYSTAILATFTVPTLATADTTATETTDSTTQATVQATIQAPQPSWNEKQWINFNVIQMSNSVFSSGILEVKTEQYTDSGTITYSGGEMNAEDFQLVSDKSFVTFEVTTVDNQNHRIYFMMSIDATQAPVGQSMFKIMAQTTGTNPTKVITPYSQTNTLINKFEGDEPSESVPETETPDYPTTEDGTTSSSSTPETDASTPSESTTTTDTTTTTKESESVTNETTNTTTTTESSTTTPSETDETSSTEPSTSTTPTSEDSEGTDETSEKTPSEIEREETTDVSNEQGFEGNTTSTEGTVTTGIEEHSETNSNEPTRNGNVNESVRINERQSRMAEPTRSVNSDVNHEQSSELKELPKTADKKSTIVTAIGFGMLALAGMLLLIVTKGRD